MVRRTAWLLAALVFWCVPAAWGEARADLRRLGGLYGAEFRWDRIATEELPRLEREAPQSPRALFRLGGFWFFRERYGRAYPCFRELARRGSPDGAFLAGAMLLLGRGVEDREPEGAAWVRRAACAGHPGAAYVMGELLRQGLGVPRNPGEGALWTERAARSGFTEEALTSPAKYVAVLGNWRRNPGGAREASVGQPRRQDQVQVAPGARLPGPEGVAVPKMERAWKRLAAATGFHAYLMYDDGDTVNAFVTRDKEGRPVVVVYRGLLEILRREDEIAGVLGHEAGHGGLGHLEAGARYDAGVSLAANLLSRLLDGGALADLAIGTGAELAQKGYSREQEVEADDFGTEACARAGYSPWGLYDAVRRMADAGLVTPPNGFNSHPPTERRLARLKADAERLEKGRSPTPAPKGTP